MLLAANYRLHRAKTPGLTLDSLAISPIAMFTLCMARLAAMPPFQNALSWNLSGQWQTARGHPDLHLISWMVALGTRAWPGRVDVLLLAVAGPDRPSGAS